MFWRAECVGERDGLRIRNPIQSISRLFSCLFGSESGDIVGIFRFFLGLQFSTFDFFYLSLVFFYSKSLATNAYWAIQQNSSSDRKMMKKLGTKCILGLGVVSLFGLCIIFLTAIWPIRNQVQARGLI